MTKEAVGSSDKSAAAAAGRLTLDCRFLCRRDPRFLIDSKARQQQQQHREKALGNTAAVSDSKTHRKLQAARNREEKRHQDEDSCISQKAVLDERFSRILTDTRFLTGGGADKFGRQNKKSTRGPLPQDELAGDIARQELQELYAVAHQVEVGTNQTSLDDDEGSSDQSSSSMDSEDETQLTQDDEALWSAAAEGPLSADVSSRLAIMGLDWENVAAADLLVMLETFCKTRPAKLKHVEESENKSHRSGDFGIIAVKIFLSEFGRQRIEEEKLKGPSIDWAAAEGRKGSKDADLSSGDEANGSVEAGIKLQAVLRKYQVERSRYYYAIIETQSAETAQYIYDELDGCDIGFSLNGLDLRLVPEALELPEEAVVSVVYSNSLSAADIAAAAARLEEVGERSGSALRHCKVSVTWDETPKDRTKLLCRKFSNKELDQQDMEVFLASSEDSDDNVQFTDATRSGGSSKWKITEENIQDYRRELLGDLADGSDDSVETEDTPKPRDKNKLGVCFNNSLEALAPDSDQDGSTAKNVFKTSASVRNKKMKKSKFPVFTDGEIETETEKKDSAPATEEVQEGDGEERDFDLRKGRHKRRKPNGSARHRLEEPPQQIGFHLNVEDPRFSRVLRSPDFVIDPTNPAFKKSEGVTELLKARRDRSYKHSFKAHVKGQSLLPQLSPRKKLQGMRLI